MLHLSMCNESGYALLYSTASFVLHITLNLLAEHTGEEEKGAGMGKAGEE